MVGECVIHRLGTNLAQADMGAGDDRDRPGEAPAVAVEHRQRPEIDRMAAEIAGDDIGGREQVGAAVVIDHALGIAGGAGGVVQRDGVPFVRRHQPVEIGVARGNEFFVFDLAQTLAGAVIDGVLIVDDDRLRLAERQRFLDRLREFPVGNQHLGPAMVEREGDDSGVEARVQRVEDGAGHRHAVMAFEHGRGVRQHCRDGVVLSDAVLRQRRGEPARTGIELGIAAPERAVNDGRPAGKDRGGALQEGERRQRLEIGRVAVEIGVIGRTSHRETFQASAASLSGSHALA